VGGDRFVDATVSVRAAIPAGSAFLEGNGVEGPLVEIRKGAAVPTAAS
jgi:NADH-quinone oxidoreductase subunit G